MTDPRARSFRTHDGLELAFRDYGPADGGGVPLLCLPGVTRTARDFEHVAARHATARRVLCPDYRGRGRSQRAAKAAAYTVVAHVEDVRHLLIVAGVHEVVVLGTSFGGLLAMGLAAALPTVVRGVALNDVGPEFDPTGLPTILDFIARDSRPASWDDAVALMKRSFPNLPARDEAGWRRIAELTWQPDATGRLRVEWDVRIVEPLMGDHPGDLWPMFRALRRLPVLAIRGERSDVLSQACFDRMARELPALERVIVPNVGHAPALDEPPAQAALDAFLARFS
ncbi:MAG: alpha/beta hydrolase [Alphaproteobacteria bacterium]|nr:alpha/beta hydrolase [Alphaproteobacteria bacterium]